MDYNESNRAITAALKQAGYSKAEAGVAVDVTLLRTAIEPLAMMMGEKVGALAVKVVTGIKPDEIRERVIHALACVSEGYCRAAGLDAMRVMRAADLIHSIALNAAQASAADREEVAGALDGAADAAASIIGKAAAAR